MITFPASVRANVAYWQRWTADLLELGDVVPFVRERENIKRAIVIGAEFSEVVEESAELLLNLFRFIEQLGYGQAWTPLFNKLTIRYPTRHTNTLCQLHNRLGQLYSGDWQLVLAAEQHQRALQVAQQLNEDTQIGQSHFHLCVLHWRQKDYQKANQHGRKALQAFQSEEMIRWQSASLNMLGLIAKDSGDFAAAEKVFKQCIPLFRQHELPYKLARILNNYANLLCDQAYYQAALEQLFEAQTLLQAGDFLTDLADIRISMSRVYYEMEEWESAETILRQIDLLQLEFHQHYHQVALVVYNLGSILLEVGRVQEARYYFEKAHSHWLELGNKVMYATALANLGDVCQHEAKPSQAYEHYLEAIKYLENYSDDRWAQEQLHIYTQKRQQLEEAQIT